MFIVYYVRLCIVNEAHQSLRHLSKVCVSNGSEQMRKVMSVRKAIDRCEEGDEMSIILKF